MREAGVGQWGRVCVSRPLQPRPANATARGSSSHSAPRGSWRRRPPQPRRRGPRTPPVVELSITSGQRPGVKGGGGGRSPAHVTSSRFGADLSASYGGERDYDQARRGSVSRPRESPAWKRRRTHNGAVDFREEDVRSVCTSAASVRSVCTSGTARARSESAIPITPASSDFWAQRRRSGPPTSADACADRQRSGSGYPSAYAKVQEMVRRLRDARTPAATHLYPNESGLRELSIQGHQDSVDPVLAWSTLSRPATSDRDWTRHLSARARNSTGPTSCVSEVWSLSEEDDDDDDKDDGVGSMTGDGETMETVSVTTPFATMADEDVFQYDVSYDRRTGQILNYYANKDAPTGDADGRHDRCHRKVARSIPSQASLRRPTAPSQAGSYPQHWRSSTVPPPLQQRRAVDVSVGGGSGAKSVSGRIFMGKRIPPPPQKIVPSYRPKPVQRSGRSFVQIHRPMTLVPRSQTADYALRTRSVTSNSCEDEDSADEYYDSRARAAGGGDDARIERDMHNLRIVGTSMRTKGGGGGRRAAGDRRDPVGFLPLGRDSSKCFPVAGQDVQTQMQTISPPYSSHTSTQTLSDTSSRAVMSGGFVVPAPLLEDLCVYNHINPSPRRRDGTTDIPTSYPDVTSSHVDLTPYLASQNATPRTARDLDASLTSQLLTGDDVIAETDAWLAPPVDEQSDSGVVLTGADPTDDESCEPDVTFGDQCPDEGADHQGEYDYDGGSEDAEEYDVEYEKGDVSGDELTGDRPTLEPTDGD